MEWERAMDNLKVNLDIRTVLAQLDIVFEKFTEWEQKMQVGLWQDAEWLERSEESEDQIAIRV
jgi:hypothetical protein